MPQLNCIQDFLTSVPAVCAVLSLNEPRYRSHPHAEARWKCRAGEFCLPAPCRCRRQISRASRSFEDRSLRQPALASAGHPLREPRLDDRVAHELDTPGAAGIGIRMRYGEAKIAGAARRHFRRAYR